MFSTRFWLYAALSLSVTCFLAFVWQLSNMKGVKSRRRRKEPKRDDKGRESDRRTLGPHERKVHAQAQQLMANGSYQPAAQLLESIGMVREAVTALETHGYIHDAARMLMRIQRPNRAGVIYARHRMWEQAADCFRLANMPLEVAKCAREAGNPVVAADAFEKVGHLEDAAECHVEAGNFHQAARLFASAGNRERAVDLYRQIAENADNFATLDMRDDEVRLIMDYLAEGHADLPLADLLVNRNKLTEVVKHLVTKGMVRQASELYLRSTTDIGPQLIAEVSYTDRSAEHLADVFMAVSNFQYAGMVFEHMGAFERAGVAFEKAEDFQRSAYCYERGRQFEKAESVRRRRPTGRPSIPKAAPPRPGAPFSLSALGSEAEPVGEVTAILNPDHEAAVAEVEDEGPAVAADETEDSISKDERDAAADLPPPMVKMDESRSAFHKAAFFADLDFEQKNRLWDIGLPSRYDADESVLGFDEEPRGLYVILSGSISCYRRVGGKEQYVDQMGESETFGELWLLVELPSSVKFVASKNAKVHILPREAFNHLLDKDGTIARKLYKRFTRNLLRRLLRQQNSEGNPMAS